MMDYSEKIDYLKSYKYKKDRLTYIDNQLIGVKGINYGPSLGSRRSVNEYLAEKQRIIDEMIEIEDTIDGISNDYARLVLGYKYLQFRSFKEIAEIMDYSLSNVKRLHKKGVDLLNK